MIKQKALITLTTVFAGLLTGSVALAIPPGLEGESVRNIEAVNGISG